MPIELLWRPQALEDLIDIYVTIGLDSADAAERIYSALTARAELLSAFPRMGQRRPDVAPSARVLVEGSYLLLYEVCPDVDTGAVVSVEIVRVVDGRRELSHIFH